MDAIVNGLVDEVGRTPEELAHRKRLMAVSATTPALRPLWLAAGRSALEALQPVIRSRMPSAGDEATRALAGAVVAVLTAALED